jgi:hypothetical protein
MDKLSKAEAVYLTAAEVGGPDLGTRCGKCRDFIQLTSECVITIDPKVSAARGTCTQYIHGAPHAAGRPLLLISKESVGYIEGRDVPTYCGRCEYYGGDRYVDECAKVEGIVDYGGCCNLYHAGS